MLIEFWGANGTVTGSRTLIESGGVRLLIDCGLFQGDRDLRARNRDDFPVDPASIDAVVLTHAHIDHSGYLPALVRDGFAGPVWCTPGTAEICRLVLPDAAHLEEEEASYANKHRTSRHYPAEPLFTARDALDALALLRPVPFATAVNPIGNLRLTFAHAGHIIGASSVQLRDDDVRVTFSGDVGRPDSRVMQPPSRLQPTDVLVLESTYGNKAHPVDDSRQQLKSIANDTLSRGGTLLIPSFAVGRTQEILSLLSDLRVEGEIPDIPVYVNSPMATDATELFLRFRDEHKLSPSQCQRMSQHVQYVRSVEGSKALTRDESPKIVISASGMATGGRVLRHLTQLAPDPRNTLLFVGYQALGTRGHAIITKSRHVRIFGVDVPIRARVEHLASLSAHADMNELFEWASRTSQPPLRTYLNHGEIDASVALRETLRQRMNWHVEIPQHGDVVDTSSFISSHIRAAAHA
ncbi:MAG: MBL fold metallo-hydrolase [Actinobacteria bacterium]|jgi:metallo-beta-lactamase family protein|nr:MBL fold metallo-hydrolase [Actinomycetota bacterium]NCX31523.1 MBL fold metallo-hydrolase [Actinomycetota bacterium]NDH45344.1 MBL fold metallo-hydrolase [Actinomycetota bacterium]